MLWAAVVLLSVTNDRRWGDTQQGWQSLRPEWLPSRASGLVRSRGWEQKNIPCGPWGSWDAISLLLLVYLHTGLAHAWQIWRKPNSSPCEALQPWQSVSVCTGSWGCSHKPNPDSVQLLPGWGGDEIPWIFTDLLRAEVLEVVLNSSTESRANKMEQLIQYYTVLPGVEWLCIPV